MKNGDRQKSLEKIFRARKLAADGIMPGKKGEERMVLVAISEFSFQSFVRTLQQLHKRLGPEEKMIWQATGTRTVILFTNENPAAFSKLDFFRYTEQGIGATGLLTESEVRDYKKSITLSSSAKLGANYEYLGQWKKYRVEISEDCLSADHFLSEVALILNESLLIGVIPNFGSVRVEFRNYELNPYFKDHSLYTRVVFNEMNRQYEVMGQLYEEAV